MAWVPLLTAILANLHGGFLAVPGIVATAAFAHAVSGPLGRGPEAKRAQVRPGFSRLASRRPWSILTAGGSIGTSTTCLSAAA